MELIPVVEAVVLVQQVLQEVLEVTLVMDRVVLEQDIQ
jgi:hypothetical protein